MCCSKPGKLSGKFRGHTRSSSQRTAENQHVSKQRGKALLQTEIQKIHKEIKKEKSMAPNANNMDAWKVAELTLWTILTTRTDLFDKGAKPQDFNKPNPLPEEIQAITAMVLGPDDQPDPDWETKVRLLCSGATQDPDDPNPNSFEQVRSSFVLECSDAWTGAGGGHPGLTEFKITINS
jgi:hypothetical protein